MTTAVTHQIDLTNPPGDGLVYAEILTEAGVIRVNVNLVNWRTDQRVVSVEIERQVPERPNTCYKDAHTAPTGEWGIEIRRGLADLRTDVTLTRKAGT